MILNKIHKNTIQYKIKSRKDKYEITTKTISNTIDKKVTLDSLKLTKIKIDVTTQIKKSIIMQMLIKKKSLGILKRKYIKNIFLHTTNKQIDYIFIIKITYTNTFFNIINNSKEQLISQSLRETKFKKLDKISKKYFIVKTLQKLTTYTNENTNIALHLQNNNNQIFNKLILNFLKKLYVLQIIKFKNKIPHNGCRPKKKRRK